MGNTQVNFMSAQMLATQANDEASKQKNDMQHLEEQADKQAESQAPTKNVLFVRGETTQSEAVEEMEAVNNPAEISLDDGDDAREAGDEDTEMTLVQKEVPDEVFGGLK